MAEQMPPDLSIVIVNYNGMAFIDACLASIQQHVQCRHEVIVVDNASADGSADHVETQFPQVRLIRSSLNTGFTGGNNIGVAAARGRLVLLLNNDTKLMGSLTPAVAAFDDGRIGALGVHLQYGDGRNQASVGYEHRPLRVVLSWLGLAMRPGLPSMLRLRECDPRFYERPHPQVDWVTGAFLMTTLDLWRSIGGLDDRYFMYVEDVEYCRQVRMRGFRVAYLPEVNVTHYEGSGKAWIGRNALVRTVRSYRLHLATHHGPLAARFTCAALALVLALRVPLYAARFALRRRPIDREKAAGFAAAARRALSASDG